MNMGLYNIYRCVQTALPPRMCRLMAESETRRLRCSIAMLVVECLGASTVTLYGINLLWDPLYDKFEDDPRQPGTPKASPLAQHVLLARAAREV